MVPIPWKDATVGEARKRFPEDWKLNDYPITTLAERISISGETARPGLTATAGLRRALVERRRPGGFHEPLRRPPSLPWQTEPGMAQ